ncbi:Predicted kinase, aminoglycoside phosphotransferase (APT) family [Saccharopolyspora kobensis]|uniref:Predicted kinase, aminoglycoside phosphotransferase (APT) family n=1 Tax=Saccharopolyspora kobensis TaxID=146035 RepID=A0A1H6DT09_9PSEU|nr:phosphotransferase [Saccharopolyspora kobensis]SEG88532.1 Predicted kinase, aminoglycoside phosphotransferase (APT) family [Saccharopolyspora kobensis]SFE00302.1 Predicted kinase, aminoglycoside phosphotransferase (APT) family [Saccharopolyspora kobensis]
MEFGGGWDSAARLVGGRWVERRPRRPEVAVRLRREARLMPWLAPRLPLPVPVPEVVAEEPLVVRHLIVPGEPHEHLNAGHGRVLGRFLRCLHEVSVPDAVARGVAPAADAAAELAGEVARFRAEVVPMLALDEQRAGLALLDAVRDCPRDVLVHGDLGPEHVLADASGITGVIDFADAGIGDPALDLAWALHGTPTAFADALAAAYGVTDDQRERALHWHRLGPWYEVLHGIDAGDPDLVRSGLAGTAARLEGAPAEP